MSRSKRHRLDWKNRACKASKSGSFSIVSESLENRFKHLLHPAKIPAAAAAARPSKTRLVLPTLLFLPQRLRRQSGLSHLGRRHCKQPQQPRKLPQIHCHLNRSLPSRKPDPAFPSPNHHHTMIGLRQGLPRPRSLAGRRVVEVRDPQWYHGRTGPVGR